MELHMKTFLSGSLAYDRIMKFPEAFSDYILPEKLHEINVCFMVDGMKENFGGTAGNIAYALRLLGGDPLITSTIGMDDQRYLAWLQQNDIVTSGIRRIDHEWTAGAYITTDKNSNQLTNFNPGAMNFSSEFDFSTITKEDLMIISPGNINDMITYPEQCRKNNIPYIFDPGQSLPALQKTTLINCIDGCTLLMVNDYEMSLIEQKTGLKKEDVLQRAGNTVVTLGGKGSSLYIGESMTTVPAAAATEVADPTGAGDAYRGGLLYGLKENKPLAEACLYGSATASFAVACHGTQEYTFSQEEFSKRLRSIC